MPYFSLWQVGRFIADAFNMSELKDLCLELREIKFEDIPGDTLTDKASGLAEHMNRRGKLPELLKALDRERHEKFSTSFGSVADFQLLEATSSPVKVTEKTGQLRPVIPAWGWVMGLVLLVLTVWAMINVFRPDGTVSSEESTTKAPEVAVAPSETAPTPALAPTIKIKQPEEAAAVNREAIIHGELAGDLCQDCQVYVVVHPLHAQPNYYYWQKDAQIELSEHSFTVTGVIVGRETAADNNKQYELWALISPNPPPKLNMTSDEWLVFNKEASDHVTVTREGQ